MPQKIRSDKTLDIKSLLKNVTFWTFVIAFIIGCIVTYFVPEKDGVSYDNESDVRMLAGFHIKGAVKNPGYYELPYEKRVADAIKIAGGATAKADLDAINLAEVLRDGQEIVIPSLKEGASAKEVDKVNINNADIYKLCTVTGIDKVTAINITQYRNKNGKFKSIEELKKIDKISDKLFNKIKSKICAE